MIKLIVTVCKKAEILSCSSTCWDDELGAILIYIWLVMIKLLYYLIIILYIKIIRAYFRYYFRDYNPYLGNVKGKKKNNTSWYRVKRKKNEGDFI